MNNSFNRLTRAAAIAASGLILLGAGAATQPVNAQEAEEEESRVGAYVVVGAGTGLGTTINGSIYGNSVSVDGRGVLLGGIGVGYDFGSIRAELAGTRGWSHVDSVTLNGYKYDAQENGYSWGLDLGLAYDIPTESKIDPYIKVHGGPSWGDDSNGTAWGYGLSAGISYAASEKVDVYGEGGYRWTPAQQIDYFDADGSGQFVIGGGLRFRL